MVQTRVAFIQIAMLLRAFALQTVWSRPVQNEPPNRGAVASESKACSSVGAQLLLSGGNAADAMVGTVFCVGVIAMYHSGIGGGGFAVIRTGNGTYDFVDFREFAPKAAFKDMYQGNLNGSAYGGLASAVPGEVRGLDYIHKKYGQLPWHKVMAPAIHIARNGFNVTKDLTKAMKRMGPVSFLETDPAWSVDFAPKGHLLQEGEIMTRQRYADTLQAIAENRTSAFYAGPIAEDMIHTLIASNGSMTLDDLANYKANSRAPIQLDYHTYKLIAADAPSSGPVALSTLNTFGGFDPAGVNLSTHRLVEAMKFAYGQRSKLADPSFERHVPEYVRWMIDPKTGEQLRSKISDSSTHDASYYDPENWLQQETGGTSHIVTADATGMAVSLTTSINLFFGSRVMAPKSGIIMNNQMDDFSIPGKKTSSGVVPSPANYIFPRKRPLSSISPIIVEHPHGRLYYVIGSAGGSRITTAVIQNVIHVLDSKMTTAEALRQPRLHDQLRPLYTSFEYGYSNETVTFMEHLGHNVTWVVQGESTAQGLRLLENGTFEAAGEPRQVASGGVVV